MLAQRLLGHLAEPCRIHVGARDAHDTAVRRELAGLVAQEKGGQQLPQRQVAGAAEDQIIEGRDRCGMGGHGDTS